MLEKWIDRLQQAYNTHRAPEMWGTPQVSPGFFDLLRSKGPLAAWEYLADKERRMGDPSARPEIKAVANLVASTLLILGVRGMKDISIVGKVAFNITLGLLVFAQGDVSHMGFVGEDSSPYEADLSEAEQREVERQFDPEVDGCQMDTIARIYPKELRRRN